MSVTTATSSSVAARLTRPAMNTIMGRPPVIEDLAGNRLLDTCLDQRRGLPICLFAHRRIDHVDRRRRSGGSRERRERLLRRRSPPLAMVHQATTRSASGQRLATPKCSMQGIDAGARRATQSHQPAAAVVLHPGRQRSLVAATAPGADDLEVDLDLGPAERRRH